MTGNGPKSRRCIPLTDSSRRCTRRRYVYKNNGFVNVHAHRYGRLKEKVLPTHGIVEKVAPIVLLRHAARIIEDKNTTPWLIKNLHPITVKVQIKVHCWAKHVQKTKTWKQQRACSSSTGKQYSKERGTSPDERTIGTSTRKMTWPGSITGADEHDMSSGGNSSSAANCVPSIKWLDRLGGRKRYWDTRSTQATLRMAPHNEPSLATRTH